MEKNKDNTFVIIVKIEKYIEYMLTILLKLPRTEKFSDWGNHWNTENSPRKVVKTGSREEWCANNIYDFAGNVDEWTQEQNESSYRVIRGGCYCNNGYNYPVAYRYCYGPNGNYLSTGFRATLYIK